MQAEFQKHFSCLVLCESIQFRGRVLSVVCSVLVAVCRLCVLTLARDKRDPRVEHCTAADVESRHGN